MKLLFLWFIFRLIHFLLVVVLPKTHYIFRNMQILLVCFVYFFFLTIDYFVCGLIKDIWVVGCSIILPKENESVLLGSAILGAVASKQYPSLHDAMKALNAAGQVHYLIPVSHIHYPIFCSYIIARFSP